VNALLRKCEPPNEHLPGPGFERLSAENLDSVRRAFPEWLLTRWQGLSAIANESPAQGALRLAYASLRTPRTTLRVIDAGANLEDIRRELQSEGVATSPCLYARERGLTVESGHAQSTRAYREGRIVIQDEASQLVAELVKPGPGQRVLDLCAAPGMKAGQIAQLMGTGTVLACDVSAARLRTMAALLPKWAPAAVPVRLVRLDATRSLPFGTRFDRILLDAPCSGTGTLARNPEIKWRVRPEDITRLAEMQTAMLRHALQLLACGGRLVYATCSLEPEENEDVVEKVLSDKPGFRLLPAHELALEHPHLVSLFDSRGYFRTRPEQHYMDGFNAAVIVRSEGG
jgi:16S rRNA (cytosine967-C5)-methyltransferase